MSTEFDAFWSASVAEGRVALDREAAREAKSALDAANSEWMRVMIESVTRAIEWANGTREQ